MRSALLTGRDHTAIGAVEVVAEGNCAVSLCRGGAAKTYTHTEPNEDACMFAEGPGGVLLAVADGHHGAIGSEIAIKHLLEQQAETWTGAVAADAGSLEREAAEVISAINLAILAEAERCGLPPSPTTLCFALIRPDENLLIHGSVGDSHIFWTREAAPLEIAWIAQVQAQPAYLGYPPSPERDAQRRVACEELSETRSVVLATDGFSEEGIGHDSPETELHAIQSQSLVCDVNLRPIETCRGVAESANAIQRRNHAGDNIACAVWVPN